MGSALRPSARQCGFDWSASPAILVGKVETGLTLAAQAGTGKEFFWRPGLLPITRKVGLRKGGPKVEISHADAAVIAIHRKVSVPDGFAPKGIFGDLSIASYFLRELASRQGDSLSRRSTIPK